jgi:hypothetical protein
MGRFIVARPVAVAGTPYNIQFHFVVRGVKLLGGAGVRGLCGAHA